VRAISIFLQSLWPWAHVASDGAGRAEEMSTIRRCPFQGT
jgi:hypothetical protein